MSTGMTDQQRITDEQLAEWENDANTSEAGDWPGANLAVDALVAEVRASRAAYRKLWELTAGVVEQGPPTEQSTPDTRESLVDIATRQLRDERDALQQRIDTALGTLAELEQRSLARTREATSIPAGNSYLTGVHDAYFTAFNAVRSALTGTDCRMSPTGVNAFTGTAPGITVDRVRAAARSMLGWCDDPTADPTILGSILAPLVKSVATTPVAAPTEPTVKLTRDAIDGGWVAELSSPLGCMSQGETIPAALRNLADALTETAVVLALAEQDGQR